MADNLVSKASHFVLFLEDFLSLWLVLLARALSCSLGSMHLFEWYLIRLLVHCSVLWNKVFVSHENWEEVCSYFILLVQSTLKFERKIPSCSIWCLTFAASCLQFPLSIMFILILIKIWLSPKHRNRYLFLSFQFLKLPSFALGQTSFSKASQTSCWKEFEVATLVNCQCFCWVLVTY